MLLYNSNDDCTPIALTLLTPREWEVLLLLAEGNTATEIAEQLCITVKSVYNNKNRIGRKIALKGYLSLNRFSCKRREILHQWFDLLRNQPAKKRPGALVLHLLKTVGLSGKNTMVQAYDSQNGNGAVAGKSAGRSEDDLKHAEVLLAGRQRARWEE